ncbi:MAG TPA: hypothetical protein VMT16_03680 [Thermoanaerobaculia bacterium]|nr:hypothetical protein [Thermoanaerobaculia bacterium]
MALYDDILAIARDYMGPAAEEYIQRRIRIVQKGEAPETITPDRLERLAAGIDMTAKVYMGPTRAAAFREEVLALEGRYPVEPGDD